MATIATWNGHTFEVSPKLIRGFNGLTLKGGCETTDKNTNGQKYLERKYGEIPELSLTTQLNMLTGVTDVFTEATTWVNPFGPIITRGSVRSAFPIVSSIPGRPDM